MDPAAQRAKELFLELSGKVSPEEWEDRLDVLCAADPALRERVQALLRAHADPRSYLDRQAADLTLDPNQPRTTSEATGMVIGPYKLVEQIGEGGMGTVWMAQQTEPVKRLVALKLIKAGMDSRQVIARFEAERQALALMDHPNIAKVLDAGTIDTPSPLTPLPQGGEGSGVRGSGRPYFVMELVKGVPITRYCDEHHLTPRQRLELFVPVCQAVQHAHQKGIIHRDIKPSNVLVALYDDKPVPKIIDFGVAKATGQQLTEHTLNTGFGAVVGTLEYMSPEQAGFNQLDVDTRSDIYSLGVLLYELLAGSPPFTRKDLADAGMLEMLRVIREQEPSKPSTKLSSSDVLPSLSASRGTEPARLAKLVRGELDWIVMKALEKDRARRYETANGFAQDLQRYLADEQVQACPPSAGYRLRKFARRNKAALAMASVMAVAVLLVVASIGWTVRDRAAREKEIADERQARQTRLTDQVELILNDVERLEKEQKWPEALATAKRAEDLAGGGELDAAQRARLKQALADLNLVQRLDELRLLRAELHDGKFDHEGTSRRYAEAFRDYGVDVEALPIEEVAGRLRLPPPLREDVGAALMLWAVTRNAISAKGKQESIQRLVTLADTMDPDPWRQRLRAVWRQGKSADGKALAELAASAPTGQWPPSTRVLLATVLQSGGLETEAVQVLRGAVAEHPGDFWSNFTLGSFLYWASARDPRSPYRLESSTYFRVALGIRPRLALVWYGLGSSLYLPPQGVDEAIRCLREAIDLDPKYVHAHHWLGVILSDQRRFDEAIACLRKAIELEPSAHASWHSTLGFALLCKGQRQEAIASFRTAHEMGNSYAGEWLGNIYNEDGQWEEALACYRKLLAKSPDGTNNRLAWFLATCPDPKFRDPQQAVKLAERAVERSQKYPLHDPGRRDAPRTLGVAHYRSGDWQAAITALEKSMALRQGGDSAEWFFLAMAHWQLGAKDKARDWYDKAAQWMDKNPPNDEALPSNFTGALTPWEIRRFRAEAAELLKIEDKPNPN